MNDPDGAEERGIIATPARSGDLLRRLLVFLSYLDDTELEELYGVMEALYPERGHFPFTSHRPLLTGTLVGINFGSIGMHDKPAPPEDRATRTLSSYAALRSRSRSGPSGADLIDEAREERQARIAPGLDDG